jgi:ribosome-binding factor A
MTATMTRRQKRVAELLHQEIGQLIYRRAGDPRLAGVTVTDVEVSPDLRRAHVYVSVMGDDEARQAALDALAHATGFFRHELAATLDLRFVPDLSFHLDVSLDRAERIDYLLAHLDE